MSNWKFKAGDVIHSNSSREQYTVIGHCLEYGTNNYTIRNRHGLNLNVNKDVTEDMCELVKPKSLYEQALELLGLNQWKILCLEVKNIILIRLEI